MIGYLSGKLIDKKLPLVLLDVHGVGYEVDVPVSTFFKLPDLGAGVTLYTHLVVREDAHVLFGFLTEAERVFFRSLIRVTGVGARMALGILSGISADDFYSSVANNEIQRLIKLPGIGKKTAERLILEMRDRLPHTGAQDASAVTLSDGVSATEKTAVSPVREAVSALEALGFKPQEAESRVRAIAAQGKSSEELIRSALQAAAKK
jgi:Holliday junction DNA helicase RuvA